MPSRWNWSRDDAVEGLTARRPGSGELHQRSAGRIWRRLGVHDHEIVPALGDGTGHAPSRTRQPSLGAAGTWPLADVAHLIVDHRIEGSEQFIEALGLWLENTQCRDHGLDGGDTLDPRLASDAVTTRFDGAERHPGDASKPAELPPQRVGVVPGPVEHDELVGALAGRQGLEWARVGSGIQERRAGVHAGQFAPRTLQ